jgi:hypothetical protein
VLHGLLRRHPIRSGLLLAAALALSLAPYSSGGGFSGRNGAVVVVDGANVYLDSGSHGSAIVSDHSLTQGGASLSPDATKIAYPNGTGIAVACVPPSSCSTVQVTSSATDDEPSWAPPNTSNAGVLAFIRSGDIYTANADGSSGSPTAQTSGLTAFDPVWSPDGSKIAFAKQTNTGGDEIWVLTVGGTQSQVTISAGSHDLQPAWSPDGSTLAVQSDRTGTNQIYTVSASGGSITQVTNDGSADTAPVWSPDGSTIAFVQSGTKVVTISASGGSETTLDSGLSSAETADWQTLVPVAGSTAPTVSTTEHPIQGDTVTADPGSWDGADSGLYKYEFERCDSTGNACTPIGSFTSSSSYTLTSADVGSTIAVEVTAGNTAGDSASRHSSNYTPVVIGPGPTNITPPTISLGFGATDAPKVGTLLSATIGTWTGQGNTYKFQWKKCDVKTTSCYDLKGQTSSFMTVTGDLFGWQIRVAVFATNSAGTNMVNSDPTKPVTADLPKNTVSPQIFGGTNQVGSQLSVSTGTWIGTSPITFSYQWKRCDPQGDLTSCVAIPGATTFSYTIQDADLGHSIRAYVTGTNVAGSVPAFTNHTFPPTPAPGPPPPPSPVPANSTPPQFVGDASVGSILQGNRGVWTGRGPLKYRYQWQRCDATGGSCHNVRTATKANYHIRATDLGWTLRLSVTATNSSGKATAVSAVSDTVALRKPVPKARMIVGTDGPNYLAGGGGPDVILGLGGSDTILGGAGDDRLDGGPGNDVIDGGPGSDVIDGGPGNDTIRAVDGERDVIDCGPGKDHAFVDSVDTTVNCELVTIGTPAGSGGGSGGDNGGGDTGP